MCLMSSFVLHQMLEVQETGGPLEGKLLMQHHVTVLLVAMRVLIIGLVRLLCEDTSR